MYTLYRAITTKFDGCRHQIILWDNAPYISFDAKIHENVLGGTPNDLVASSIRRIDSLKYSNTFNFARVYR